jgi:hypothetical protein
VGYLARFWKDQQMHEVDIVLERDDGMIVGIEVKASATVTSSDFAGLRTLAEACKDRFAYGVVLYDSSDFVPFGDRLAAAPLSALWGQDGINLQNGLTQGVGRPFPRRRIGVSQSHPPRSLSALAGLFYKGGFSVLSLTEAKGSGSFPLKARC